MIPILDRIVQYMECCMCSIIVLCFELEGRKGQKYIRNIKYILHICTLQHIQGNHRQQQSFLRKKSEGMFRTQLMRKGPSINYVVSKSEIFDPLVIFFIKQGLFSELSLGLPPPPPAETTQFMDGPLGSSTLKFKLNFDRRRKLTKNPFYF